MTHDLSGASNDITSGFGYNPVSQIVSLTNSADTYEYKETATSAENHTFNGLNQDAGIAAVASNTGFDQNGNLQKDGSRPALRMAPSVRRDNRHI